MAAKIIFSIDRAKKYPMNFHTILITVVGSSDVVFLESEYMNENADFPIDQLIEDLKDAQVIVEVD